MITREDLRGYQDLLIEIDSLDAQIEGLYNTYHSPQWTDTGAQFHRDEDGPTMRALHRIDKLKKHRLELYQLQNKIEDYVSGIDDPRERTICRLHYLAGYSWQATCFQMRKHASAGMIIEHDRRYWERIEKQNQSEEETKSE